MNFSHLSSARNPPNPKTPNLDFFHLSITCPPTNNNMVQTKVSYKPPLKASSSPIPKPPWPKNHDEGTKVANKMRRSGSFDSIPSYMKSTRCFEARKEKAQAPEKPGLVKVRSRSLNRNSTATCSSTLKDGKFPPFLDLNPGGTSSVKVCRYSHCSLNHHKHDAKPPLKSFLLSRRKVLREQRIEMKTPPKDEKGGDVSLLSDFLVEIYVNKEEEKAEGVIEKESDEMVQNECEYGDLFDEASSMELEVEQSLYFTGSEIGDGGYEQSDYGSDFTFVRSSRDDDLGLVDVYGAEKDGVEIGFLKEGSLAEESNEFSRDEITQCYVQFSDSESWANDVYAEETQQDHGYSDGEDSGALSKKKDEASELEDEKIKDSPESCEETSIDEVLIQASSPDSEETNTCKTRDTIIRRRKQGESLEELKPFNPRGPNFLELEEEDEAEKVDLRHQEMEKRRNAEEWMLDYALRNAVNRLSPGSQRKVSLLVEAFEKVAPPDCI